MARSNSTIVNLSQYLAARAVCGLMHSFDVKENLATAASLGSMAFRMNKGRRERAMENVRLSFPEFDEPMVHSIVERSYQHMVQLFLVDAIASPRLISPNGWPRYIRLGELRSAIDLFVKNRPSVLITGHCGNWELMGSFIAALGFSMVALARPLDNPYLSRWLFQMREARGTKIITKWGAIPAVQEELRRGGRVAFIADQNAGDQGLFVPFFGRLASSYKSIALVAMRHKVPVVCGFAKRLQNGFRYEIKVLDVISPEDWADVPDPIFYITARYNRAIERMVREAPEQYLWVHRRWKSRPRFEREGKPMPHRLRDKLASLPWMTDDELSQIVNASNTAPRT